MISDSNYTMPKLALNNQFLRSKNARSFCTKSTDPFYVILFFTLLAFLSKFIRILVTLFPLDLAQTNSNIFLILIVIWSMWKFLSSLSWNLISFKLFNFYWLIAKYPVVGVHQGSIFAKDTRNPAVQAADPSSEDKRAQWLEFEAEMFLCSYSMGVPRAFSYFCIYWVYLLSSFLMIFLVLKKGLCGEQE